MPNGNDLPIFDDPPHKHVLLLTCMDQRLLDDTVRFMNKLNLQNRYDQLVFAGASMGARRLKSPKNWKNPNGKQVPWRSLFFHHLEAAIDVLHRDIHDIFLLEHLDCGAYKYLHKNKKLQARYACAGPQEQTYFHRRETAAFAEEVAEFCCWKQKNQQTPDPKAWENIRITSFVMDLVGRVTQF